MQHIRRMQKLCHRRTLSNRNNNKKMVSNSNAHPCTNASAQISVNANSQTNFAIRSSIIHGRGRGGGSIGVKRKCNIQAFALVIEFASKNCKEIVDVM
jgi:hypothetical protein